MHGMFRNQPSALRKDRGLFQLYQDFLHPAFVIRRIHKNQIKPLPLFIQQVDRCLCIMLQHFAFRFRTALLNITFRKSQGNTAVINKLHQPGPPAPGFQPQITASGKQIQYRGIHDLASYNVKQGFLDPVRRGPYIIIFGHVQMQSPRLSGNNSHRVSDCAFLTIIKGH